MLAFMAELGHSATRFGEESAVRSVAMESSAERHGVRTILGHSPVKSSGSFVFPDGPTEGCRWVLDQDVPRANRCSTNR